MAKQTNPTIEKLQQEALGESADQPMTLSNLAEAYEMFEAMLKLPHANATKIGKLAGINVLAIGDLKNRKLTKITDAMFGKLKSLHDGLKSGAVVFEETKRGRKAGVPVAPKQKKASAAKPVRKVKLAKLPAMFGNTPLVTKEMIAEKEEQMKALGLEIEYLKEMKKLQEKFIGRG